MRAYINPFLDLMMLRGGPQNIPESRFLFWLTFFLTFMLALIQGAFIFEPAKNLAFNLFDAMLLLLFVHFLLRSGEVLPRFWQTMTALFGTGIFFRLLVLPPYIFIQAFPQDWSNPLFILCIMLVLGLLICQVFVMGHIFRHALACSMTVGVLTAMGYVVVNNILMRLVFGQ